MRCSRIISSATMFLAMSRRWFHHNVDLICSEFLFRIPSAVFGCQNFWFRAVEFWFTAPFFWFRAVEFSFRAPKWFQGAGRRPREEMSPGLYGKWESFSRFSHFSQKFLTFFKIILITWFYRADSMLIRNNSIEHLPEWFCFIVFLSGRDRDTKYIRQEGREEVTEEITTKSQHRALPLNYISRNVQRYET